MSKDDSKLTPEQAKQMQQINEMIKIRSGGAGGMLGGMQGGQGSGMQGQGGMPPSLGSSAISTQPKISWAQRLSPRNMFITMLKGMQSCVKFIDQFTQLVLNKDNEKTNSVLKSARSPIIFGSIIVIFFVIFGLTWSAIAPLDSAAGAMGTVISVTKRRAINHNEAAIIKDIYVKDGDRVKKGAKLMEFESSNIRSRYESYLHQYRTFLASETRLNAQLNEEERVYFPEFLLNSANDKQVNKIMETQTNIFNFKNERHVVEKEAIRQKIEQLHAEIKSLNAKNIALTKSLEVTRDRLKATKELNQQGYAQKERLLEYETKEANLLSELATVDANILKNEQEVTRSNLELVNYDYKVVEEILTELKETQSRLSESREGYFTTKDALERTIVRSPANGIVNNINFHTKGSTIPGGQTIMEISPIGDDLLIEAKISPKLIDSVVPGMEAKIRFSAFKSRSSPVFRGKVIYVSPDIIKPQDQIEVQQMASQFPQSGGYYYLVKIELDKENFDKHAIKRGLKLQTGMQAEIQIITGERTLLRYLLDPLVDAMFKGLKEK